MHSKISLGSISINGRLCHVILSCNSSSNDHIYTLDLTPIDALVGFVTIDDDPPTDEEVINDEIYLFEHHSNLRISKIRPFTHDGESLKNTFFSLL